MFTGMAEGDAGAEYVGDVGLIEGTAGTRSVIIRLLKKKRLDPEFSVPDEINELDIFKSDSSELPELSKTNCDEQAWPFFSEPYKNVKGKQAHLTNGNWEKTGNNREVRDKSTGKRIGGRKNYIYYKRGGSPKQKIKTDWVMHDYYVDDDDSRYKKDFVFRYVEKNPTGKPNTSTPDDGQPSHRLASDAETYAEKTSTEVESQQPSTHCLGNEFLEVESELQSNHSLVSDTGNYFATNTSTLEEPRLLSNQNLGFDTRNYEFADNTSSMEVEPGQLSNHNLFHDPFAPITSSMVQPQLLSNRDMEFDLRNHFVPNTSMVGPQLPSNHNMVFDLMNHSTPCTSSMVRMNMLAVLSGTQLLSNQNMAFDPINHFASITSSMQIESQLLSNQNLVFDPMNNSTPCISSMLGPQLLSNQNMVFDPINHYASITSSMQVESQLLSNQNLVFDPMNNFAPCTSSMVRMNMLVGPQLLSNQNMVFDPINHYAPITSSMVAHDQLLSNHNFFSDPRNHFAPNTCLMVHPQQVAELFAQFTALFGRYLLNHSSVSTPPWPTNPQQGSYSSLYSNGAFGNNCTSSSSQFHGGLEDARIAQRNFQDKHPEEVTGQDSSY
ncbi:hypothetical protein Patl1_17912 [Pistacia atlantica]|uniref:Uncharacterized protein n=1 Tax=Pistacia atlantica TaxID=434234 RepID=A0ACC1C1U0_9ROSI|nr:hypothetical protein Patl1_17912 [Pistacia atlantica]